MEFHSPFSCYCYWSIIPHENRGSRAWTQRRENFIFRCHMMGCTRIYNPWIKWGINCNQSMMITFMRSKIFFLLLLDSLWNEVSKVVLLKCMYHKIDLFLHTCGFFMIRFIEVSALLSLILGIWRVFGAWRIIKGFGISIFPVLFGWPFSIMHGECMCFGIFHEAHMYEFCLLLCKRLNEQSQRKHFPTCSKKASSRMEIGDIYNLFRS